MSRFVHAAVVEDDKSERHQFVGFTEEELNAEVAKWVRPRWYEEFGVCPEDDAACIEIYFDNMAGPPFVGMGFEHTLTSLEPIEILDLEDSGYMGDLSKPGGASYPMEIFVNGELNFKYDSPDAEGDLRAIKSLMTWRTARREGRPLTDMELYGTDRPHDVSYRSAHGKTRVVPMSASPAAVTQTWELPVDTLKVTLEALASPPAACTFKKGGKDPCPTCPRLITCLHSCGLLQDELHEAHRTGHAEPGGED